MLCYEQTDRSWLSRGLPVSKPWTKLLFSIDDQRALVTLQLSAFCGTAHHAVFAIKTSFPWVLRKLINQSKDFV